MSIDTTEPKTAVLNRPSRLLGLVVVGLLFFMLTSPRAIPSVMLITGFVVLAAILYCCSKLLLILTGLNRKMTMVTAKGVVLVCVLLPVLLIVLQSIGQLTVRDILTLGGLVLVGIFYVSRVRLGGQ